MGQVTQDPEVFRDRWNSHIDELASLGMSIDAESISTLRELQDELRELVDEGASNF